MNDEYKLGYENGRRDVFEGLKRELTNQSEPLFKEILSGNDDEFVGGELNALSKIKEWVESKQNEDE